MEEFNGRKVKEIDCLDGRRRHSQSAAVSLSPCQRREAGGRPARSADDFGTGTTTRDPTAAAGTVSIHTASDARLPCGGLHRRTRIAVETAFPPQPGRLIDGAAFRF